MRNETPASASTSQNASPLPSGVDDALWTYLHDRPIADDFDTHFAQTNLFRTDRAFLEHHFRKPGRLLDLGCGTGRLAIPFARRGFQVVGVDLSIPMLEVANRKRIAASANLQLVMANLCNLGGFGADTFDYAICMFSTLGMVIGKDQRHRVLRQVHRVLRPDGSLALHLHNWWYNLFDANGRRFIVGDVVRRLLSHPQAGDKVLRKYRGISNLRLHVFTIGEIGQMLRRTGFVLTEVLPLAPDRSRPIQRPWLLGHQRANGWLLLARRG